MLLQSILLQPLQLFLTVIFTAVSTAPDEFPRVTGMWPVKGMTAGGSRITFYGQRLNVLSPLGAHFIPSNDTGLPAVYGFAHSRSEALKLK